MKLADKKGAQAIAALGGLLEPLSRLFSDEKFKEIYKEGVSTMKFISYLLKEHPEDILEILAIRDGEDPATYDPTFTEVPAKIIETFTDDSFLMLFPSLGQNATSERSGSVKGNTKARKK